MAESTTLVGKKSGILVAPVFVGVVALAALGRGLIAADTTTGRIVMIATLGTLLVLCVVYAVWILRRPHERLEIGPDRIVWWLGPDRGIQLGNTPPIQVRRVFTRAGSAMSARWVLTDASGSAFRVAGQDVTPLEGALARIDLSTFHPTAVFEALQRAGWQAEQQT